METKQIIKVRFGNLGFIPSITRSFVKLPNTNEIARNTISISSEKARNTVTKAMTPTSPNWENLPESFLCR